MRAAALLFRGALLCMGLAACNFHDDEADAARRYQRWLQAGHAREVAAYTDFLAKERLQHVVPIAQLLHTGRRWRKCGADEFSVPQRSQWAAMTPTLRLLADLQDGGLLDDARVASAWRSPGFNACEGGSTQSRHLANNAVDLDFASDADVDALCGYWRTHGAAQRFGLGFYSTRRIHVDTSGFRTWGRDHRRGTSLCVVGHQPLPSAPPP